MKPLARRHLERVTLADAVSAVGVAAATILVASYLSGGHDPDPLGDVLLAASAVPLALRRSAPVASLAAIVVLAVAYAAVNGPNAVYALPLGVALYAATSARGWRVAATAVAMVALGSLVVGSVTGHAHLGDMGNATWVAGWLVASIVLGEESRARRQLVRQAEQRVVEAERTREAEAVRRVGEERIRIARELHDALAHRISVINVQASAGLHLMDRQPEQARLALTAIHSASKEALVELRATLGVLRQADEREPRPPDPGLAQLDGIIEDARSTGLSVSMSVDGAPRVLPAGVDLAAYRIVQESLTNVIRHGHAATTRIAIAYRSRDLTIDVQDNGAGNGTSPAGALGSGLIGMRERAAALGGEVEAGPVSGGGFRVHARLPIDRVT